jgi:nucleoside-diphosphate-sugar epimerase
MRVMITGGTGFVGFHSTQALLAAGHEVCLLVRSVEKAENLYGKNVPDLVVGDITDVESVTEALRGCDAVIHSAAMVSTDAKDAQMVYDTNVNGAKTVINSALEQNIGSIIHVSSVTALFDPRADVLDGNSPPGTAKNAYGRSKVDCEKFVRKLQDKGAPVHITYPASVIGPDDPGMTEPHIGLQTYLSVFIPLMPGGNQFVDVRDVADVHLRLLESDMAPGRFTLGGHFRSWPELALNLERLTGRKLIKVPATGTFMRGLGTAVDLLKRVKQVDVPMGHEAMVYATRWVPMDNSQVEKQLDFRFRPLDDSLQDTIGWLLEAGHVTEEQAGAGRNDV